MPKSTNYYAIINQEGYIIHTTRTRQKAREAVKYLREVIRRGKYYIHRLQVGERIR